MPAGSRWHTQHLESWALKTLIKGLFVKGGSFRSWGKPGTTGCLFTLGMEEDGSCILEEYVRALETKSET